MAHRTKLAIVICVVLLARSALSEFGTSRLLASDDLPRDDEAYVHVGTKLSFPPRIDDFAKRTSVKSEKLSGFPTSVRVNYVDLAGSASIEIKLEADDGTRDIAKLWNAITTAKRRAQDRETIRFIAENDIVIQCDEGKCNGKKIAFTYLSDAAIKPDGKKHWWIGEIVLVPNRGHFLKISFDRQDVDDQRASKLYGSLLKIVALPEWKVVPPASQPTSAPGGN